MEVLVPVFEVGWGVHGSMLGVRGGPWGPLEGL